MLDSANMRCNQCMHTITNEYESVCQNCGYPIANKQKLSGYLPPGTILANRYELGNVLHHGGEHALYIAFDTHLEVIVDIKEFFPQTLAKRNDSSEVIPNEENIEIFERLLTEFKNLNTHLSKFRTLSNIIQIYSVFDQNQTCYVVQEHPTYKTLREYLSENYGELSWSQASPMLINLMKTMSRLHKNGILHCGLSPETIYVDATQTCKLTSFSTASLRHTNDYISAELHDGYAAPEQYKGEMCGSWTDVYGMASVLYKTLTGTMPTSSNTRAFNDNLIAPDVLNENVPKNVSLAIMSALTLAPKLRTQTMDDLFADAVTPPRPVQKTMELNYNDYYNEDFYTEEIEVQDEGPKTKKIVFLSLIISLGVVATGVIILMLILFGGTWFK